MAVTRAERRVCLSICKSCLYSYMYNVLWEGSPSSISTPHPTIYILMYPSIHSRGDHHHHPSTPAKSSSSSSSCKRSSVDVSFSTRFLITRRSYHHLSHFMLCFKSSFQKFRHSTPDMVLVIKSSAWHLHGGLIFRWMSNPTFSSLY